MLRLYKIKRRRKLTKEIKCKKMEMKAGLKLTKEFINMGKRKKGEILIDSVEMLSYIDHILPDMNVMEKPYLLIKSDELANNIKSAMYNYLEEMDHRIYMLNHMLVLYK